MQTDTTHIYIDDYYDIKCHYDDKCAELEILAERFESRSGWHNPRSIQLHSHGAIKRHNHNIRNQLPQRIRINETKDQINNPN